MKCGRLVSGTAGGRWRRQRRTEVDGDELSVALSRRNIIPSQSLLLNSGQLSLAIPVGAKVCFLTIDHYDTKEENGEFCSVVGLLIRTAGL